MGERHFDPVSERPSRRAALLRGLALCALAALAARVGGSFWLCLPAALVLAAPRRSVRGALTAGALPALAAFAAAGSRPPPPALAIVVVAACVLVLHRVGASGRAERAALRRSALTDPLTGAANRRALTELVDYEIARHARLRHSFAVVALDLDGFKLVNDRFGHPAGDGLLRDVAEALRQVVRDQDTVARLGGDEFCVLAPETDESGAERLAARVAAAIGRVTAGLDTLSASIGVALYPVDGGDARAVLEAADAAQVDAKRRSRGRGRQAA